MTSQQQTLSVLLGIAAAALLSANSSADIINVPGDYSTIQAAIDAASNGDEIVVAPGTYFEAINFDGKAVNLHSSDGPNLTTIDGTGLMDSVVKCVGGEGGDTVLDGFTITGGVAVNGGGMRIENSNPTVMNCTFTENTATDRGGGMFNSGSNPAVTNCTFTNNTAWEMAGGMQNEFGSNPTISNCTFIQNTSNGQAGGLRNYIDSHPTITDCVFFENTAAIDGGGMGNRKNSNPTVANSSFIGNIAGSGGGGMDNHVGNAVATGNPTIINCLFFGNIGGGMRNNDPSPIVTNCTFVDNIGHGMFNRQGATPQVANCIFWGNTEGSIDGDSTPNVTFSNVQGGFPGTGNIDADPLFVDNNYSLASGSPCIDTADNTTVPKGITTDLDGNPRFHDDTGTADSGNPDGVNPIVDMGVYEFQGTTSSADLTGPLGVPDGCVDAFDLGAMLSAWCSGMNDPNPPSPPCENCTPENLSLADIAGPGSPPNNPPDGCVDAFDLGKLLANWEPCSE